MSIYGFTYARNNGLLGTSFTICISNLQTVRKSSNDAFADLRRRKPDWNPNLSGAILSGANLLKVSGLTPEMLEAVASLRRATVNKKAYKAIKAASQLTLKSLKVV